ncbi:hypothetical protein IWQ61_003239 [Dispira simplex]|nr:hypothetical protein IWQ61_003239 [Dispira simplex]
MRWWTLPEFLVARLRKLDQDHSSAWSSSNNPSSESVTTSTEVLILAQLRVVSSDDKSTHSVPSPLLRSLSLPSILTAATPLPNPSAALTAATPPHSSSSCHYRVGTWYLSYDKHHVRCHFTQSTVPPRGWDSRWVLVRNWRLICPSQKVRGAATCLWYYFEIGEPPIVIPSKMVDQWFKVRSIPMDSTPSPHPLPCTLPTTTLTMDHYTSPVELTTIKCHINDFLHTPNDHHCVQSQPPRYLVKGKVTHKTTLFYRSQNTPMFVFQLTLDQAYANLGPCSAPHSRFTRQAVGGELTPSQTHLPATIFVVYTHKDALIDQPYLELDHVYVFFDLSYREYSGPSGLVIPCLYYTNVSHFYADVDPYLVSLSDGIPSLQPLALTLDSPGPLVWNDHHMGDPITLPTSMASHCAHSVIDYQGRISRVLDVVLGLFELDGKYLLSLHAYPAYSIRLPYRPGTQLAIRSLHMGRLDAILHFWHSSATAPSNQHIISEIRNFTAYSRHGILWGCVATNISVLEFPSTNDPLALPRLIRSAIPPWVRFALGTLDWLVYLDTLWCVENCSMVHGNSSEPVDTVGIFKFHLPGDLTEATEPRQLTWATFMTRLVQTAFDPFTNFVLHVEEDTPPPTTLLPGCATRLWFYGQSSLPLLPKEVIEWVRQHRDKLWSDPTLKTMVTHGISSTLVIPSSWWISGAPPVVGKLQLAPHHPAIQGWTVLTDHQGGCLPVYIESERPGTRRLGLKGLPGQVWLFRNYDLVIEKYTLEREDAEDNEPEGHRLPSPTTELFHRSPDVHYAVYDNCELLRVYIRCHSSEGHCLALGKRYPGLYLPREPARSINAPGEDYPVIAYVGQSGLPASHVTKLPRVTDLIFLPTYVHRPQASLLPKAGRTLQTWAEGLCFPIHYHPTESSNLSSTPPLSLAIRSPPLTHSSAKYPFPHITVASLGTPFPVKLYARANRDHSDVNRFDPVYRYCWYWVRWQNDMNPNPPQRLVVHSIQSVTLVRRPESTESYVTGFPEQDIDRDTDTYSVASLFKNWWSVDARVFYGALHMLIDSACYQQLESVWRARVVPQIPTMRSVRQVIEQTQALDQIGGRARPTSKIVNYSVFPLFSFRGKILNMERMGKVSTTADLDSNFPASQWARVDIGIGEAKSTVIFKVQDLSTLDALDVYCNDSNRLHTLGLLLGAVVEFDRAEVKVSSKGKTYASVLHVSTIRVVCWNATSALATTDSLSHLLPVVDVDFRNPLEWKAPFLASPEQTAVSETANSPLCPSFSPVSNGSSGTPLRSLAEFLDQTRASLPATVCQVYGRVIKVFLFRLQLRCSCCSGEPSKQRGRCNCSTLTKNWPLGSKDPMREPGTLVSVLVKVLIEDGTANAVVHITDWKLFLDLFPWTSSQLAQIQDWLEEYRSVQYFTFHDESSGAQPSGYVSHIHDTLRQWLNPTQQSPDQPIVLSAFQRYCNFYLQPYAVKRISSINSNPNHNQQPKYRWRNITLHGKSFQVIVNCQLLEFYCVKVSLPDPRQECRKLLKILQEPLNPT